jgi:putative FmdB family regulatory protein
LVLEIAALGELDKCGWLETRAVEVYNFFIYSSVGGPMPHYEFFCHDCKKFFSRILSLVDYEEGEIVCPKCGSKRVEQRWSPFTVITSKKSA